VALVKNIYSGLTAWTGSGTSYTLGQRRSNGGNAYQCITAGTGAASGGPSGTGLLIQDNTAWWTYLSAIDYTGVDTFVTGALPSGTTAFTQQITGQIWNDGLIAPTITSGGSYFNPTGAPTSSFPLILTAAPGESFSDTLHARPQGSTALAYSAGTTGVAISMANCQIGVNFFNINVPYTTISRLMITDTVSSSGSTIINGAAAGTNLTIDSCIIDGYSQGGGAVMCYFPATGLVIRNTLGVDRQPAIPGGNEMIYADSSCTAHIVNCTFIAINTPATTEAVLSNNTSAASVVISNCASFGYPSGIGTSSGGVGGISIDHCVLSSASIGASSTDGGSNLLSKTASNQFISATTDFRLKAKTADCFNAGAVQSTYVPGLCDIAGTPRPQGSPYWDVGCWEFLVPIVYRRNLIRLRMKHLLTADPVDLSRRDWQRLADHFRDGYLTGSGRWI
jgi:hypothetical protein